jgi:hypothetical protein
MTRRLCENAPQRTSFGAGAHLLFSLSAHVVAILVKNQVGDLPIRLFEEL